MKRRGWCGLLGVLAAVIDAAQERPALFDPHHSEHP
jgi:hypothetical protein